MTIQIPPRTYSGCANGYDPARSGCTAEDCGTQDTEFLDPKFGRRCAAHPPWRAHAAAGDALAAFASLRAWLLSRGWGA